jgi:hypothetical protein
MEHFSFLVLLFPSILYMDKKELSHKNFTEDKMVFGFGGC